MSTELLLGIIGLAMLDSFNPATMVTVALILLLTPRRPGLTDITAISGAAVSVFTIGAALFLTAGAAAGAVGGIVVALRFLTFGAGGIALMITGARRLRDRDRTRIALPAWFRPATALPFGIVVTAADLPNAFPYFIAIERMVSSDIRPSSGLAVIGLYTVLLHPLPCAPHRRTRLTTQNPRFPRPNCHPTRSRHRQTVRPGGGDSDDVWGCCRLSALLDRHTALTTDPNIT